MDIVFLHIRNFRAFKDVTIENIPRMAVFIGPNGAGKSTLFDVFEFLRDCLEKNVQIALNKRGGFSEVMSRDSSCDICLEFGFRFSPEESIITYELAIAQNEGKSPIIKREVIRLYSKSDGTSRTILDFSGGERTVTESDLGGCQEARMISWKTADPSILAIKGLGQLEKFPAVVALRQLIEGWRVFDLRTDNIWNRDDAEPVSERNTLLCVENPESHLCAERLHELCDEIRKYSMAHGQVFLSTHSPDIANTVRPEELFCLTKRGGYTDTVRCADLPLIRSLYEAGEQLGELWRQGVLFTEAYAARKQKSLTKRQK